jgi:biopolymer transport protein ExbB
VVVVAWILERALRMRGAVLGTRGQAELLVAASREAGPARALDLARANPTVLSRIFRPVFERWQESRPSLEKAVEDTGSRELRGLVTALRPLTVIAVTAPLLGLLGTVIGIIIAFRDIALSDAIGKPEALAVGIAQALVTTASGLVVAIPAQVSYYWYRARIDRFRRLVEETGEQVFAVHGGQPLRLAPSAPPAHSPLSPASLAPDQAPVVAQAAS